MTGYQLKQIKRDGLPYPTIRRSFWQFVIVTLIIFGLVWLYQTGSSNLKEYNNHICHDVYGLNDNCQ